MAVGRWTALILLVASSAFPASMPPRYRFKSMQAGRIKVHFHAEVEGPARRTMALVLEILPRLEERYRIRIPSLEVVGFSKLLRMCPVPVVVAPRVAVGGPETTFPIAS